MHRTLSRPMFSRRGSLSIRQPGRENDLASLVAPGSSSSHPAFLDRLLNYSAWVRALLQRLVIHFAEFDDVFRAFSRRF